MDSCENILNIYSVTPSTSNKLNHKNSSSSLSQMHEHEKRDAEVESSLECNAEVAFHNSNFFIILQRHK